MCFHRLDLHLHGLMLLDGFFSNKRKDLLMNNSLKLLLKESLCRRNHSIMRSVFPEINLEMKNGSDVRLEE